MGLKRSILTNMGMRRDLDVSREDGKHAYENFNVRITASDDETQLAVTNARGNVRLLPRLVTHKVTDGGGWTDFVVSEDENLVIEGLLVGYGVLNNYLVLFTHSSREGDATPDRIYRVEYRPGSDPEWVGMPLLESDYGFSAEAPIETLCDFESEDVQKVYWTDGLNQPRFINIADKYMSAYGYDPERTQVDFVARFGSGLKAEISKSYATSGAFSGGCLQYVFTYSNKFGQQSNIALISPMYYASPYGRGANEEETVNCSFDITLSGADETWDYINIYRIMQTAESGAYTACLVATLNTGLAEQTYNDNGANVETVDASSLLYVGGRVITAYTMCAKDQTLFLGNLGLKDIAVDPLITSFFADGLVPDKEYGDDGGRDEDAEKYGRDARGYSPLLSFELTDDLAHSIPYTEQDGYYPYASQLDLSSDQMRTFKAGEKYRIGVRFVTAEGSMTSCYWVGDVEQTLYPVTDLGNERVRKAHLVCRLPDAFVEYLLGRGYVRAELMMAQASAYDRSVVAQGIVVPTLFSLEERYNDSPYAYSSWYARPRGGAMANRHFENLPRNDDYAAELQCTNENATPYCSTNDPYDGYAFKVVDVQVRHKTYFRAKVKVYYCTDVPNDKSSNVSDYSVSYPTDKKRYSEAKNVKSAINDCLVKAGFKTFATVNKNLISHLVNNLGLGGDLWSDVPFAHTKLDYASQWVHLFAYEYDNGSKLNSYHKDSYTEQEIVYYAYSRSHLVSINGLSSSLLERYCSMHKNSFFVDESVCTFHSPEITAESQSLFQNAGYRLRVIGMAKVTSNITDYEMEVEDKLESTSEVVSFSFSSTKCDGPVVGLMTFPFYSSYAVNAEINDSDKKPLTPGAGDFALFYIYPFHKTGSISKVAKSDAASGSGDKYVTTDSGETYDNMVTKTESNMRCCLRTDYLWGERLRDITDGSGAVLKRTSWEPSAGIESVVCFSSTEDEPKVFDTPDGKKTYMGNYDVIRSCRYRNDIDGDGNWGDNKARSGYDDGYLIYNTGVTINDMSPDALYDTFLPSGVSIYGDLDDEGLEEKWGSNTDLNEYYFVDDKRKYLYSDKYSMFYDPVQVSVKSTPHAVVSMRKRDATDGDGNSVKQIVTLPSLWLKVGSDDPDSDDYAGVDTLADPIDDQYDGMMIIPWEDGDELSAYDGYGSEELFCSTEIAAMYSQSEPYKMYNGGGITGGTYDGFTFEFKFEGYASDDDGRFALYRAFMEYAYGSYDPETGEVGTLVGGRIVFTEDASSSLLYGVFAGVAPGCFFADRHETVEDPDGTTHEEVITAQEQFVEAKCTITVVVTPYYDDKMADTFLGFTFTTPDGSNYAYTSRDSVSEEVGSVDEVCEIVLEGIHFSDSEEDRLYVDEAPDAPYYFIAELYTDYAEVEDNRYGGISENAVEGNVFLSLGNATWLSEAETDGGDRVLRAYSGDTYFQRWDCQKTYKYSDSSENNINEFVSVMLETYTNIEGRCDVYRGFSKLDVCTPDNTNVVNPAYNNLGTLFSSTVLDEKYSLEDLSTQLTWTLSKGATADVDNWTNVSLASTLDMDGSKGPVRALRMVNNSIICFQDRAVSQVAFNERAQVSTENGVPVELANSGRVDGKRIISDSNGCSNKWSIAQTSGGLYYVDDVRRSLVRFGERMDDLSKSKGLSVWVRGLTALKPWKPGTGRNFRTFYDRTLHDVYFSRGAAEDGLDTLCFSETLDEFMTFHSWGAVTMLESVGDRLVAADTDEDGSTRLWLQGEGPHDMHFGAYQDFHVTFRAAPEPLSDKTFTNLEYRADMFDCAGGDALTGETFQRVDVWDEHQTGGADLSFDSYRDRYPDVRRKFRIWRADIPREDRGDNNPFGLNRMRNPWLFLKLTRRASEYGGGTDLRMVMHDLLITYFE